MRTSLVFLLFLSAVVALEPIGVTKKVVVVKKVPVESTQSPTAPTTIENTETPADFTEQSPTFESSTTELPTTTEKKKEEKAELTKFRSSLIKKTALSYGNALWTEAEEIAAKCESEIQKLLGIKLETNVSQMAVLSYWTLAEGRMNLAASVDAMNTRFEQTPLRICREVAYQWFGEVLAERHNSTGYDFVRGGLTSFFQFRSLRSVINDDEYLKSEVVRAHEQAFEDPNLPLIPLAYQSDLEAPTLEIGSLHAAAIFRMIKRVMGCDRFYAALSRFLLAPKFSDDMTEDLIVAFEKEMDGQMLCGKLTIRDFVHDFFYERNFPVVHVDADESKRTFVFAQSASAPAESKWNVPMFVWSNRTKETSLVWLLKEGGLCIPDGRAGLQLDDAAYVFNYDAQSFARLVYSDVVLQRVLEMPDTTLIDEATQLDLLYGEKWLISFNYQLELYKLLRKISRVFAGRAEGRAEFPGMRVSPQRSRQLLQKFAADAKEKGMSPQVVDLAREWLHDHEIADSKCSWEATDYRCGHFNKRHLQAAVMSNRTDAREQGRRMFDEFAKACGNSTNFFECNKLPIDSRPAVYCAGIIDEEPEPMAFLEKYRAFLRELLDVYGLMHDENAYITEGFLC